MVLLSGLVSALDPHGATAMHEGRDFWPCQAGQESRQPQGAPAAAYGLACLVPSKTHGQKLGK